MRAVPDSAVRAFLDDGPVFCFTTDIEWSPEWAIEQTFALADRHAVPLTPFLTHGSAFMTRRLSDQRHRRNAGIHPNFLPGSTHGSTADAVIAATTALLPGVRASRSHCFYDDTRTLRKLESKGIRYDSNALAFLQPRLVPTRTATRVLRFPVFWEDDVHSGYGLEWTVDALRDALESPGLKIFNVHPLRVATNTPDEPFYESRRYLFDAPPDRRAEIAHDGPGTRTLLDELMTYATSGGRKAVALDSLHDRARERGFAVED
ncbi:MAG TPA: hypothetical protein VIA63_08975 [Candidatus Limnocylindria bacterium]